MSRTLNKKQKEYLIRQFEDGVRECNHLTPKELKVLERMNNHEALYYNINRFLADRKTEVGY